jgi:hypothetical protein
MQEEERMQEEEFDIQGASAFLNIPITTLKFWRAHGTGPVFYKLGKRVRYSKSDLLEFKKGKRMRLSVRKKKSETVKCEAA